MCTTFDRPQLSASEGCCVFIGHEYITYFPFFYNVSLSITCLLFLEELRSNDPGMTDFSRTEFEDTSVTTQDYDGKENFVQFQVSVNSDERLALSARNTKDEDDVKLTEDVDQSSSVSESSTLTTGKFTNNMLVL